MGSRSGKILRIEKTSIHDGAGLRTVVFVKGCPLRCKWCSTPESHKMECDSQFGREMTADEIIKEICKDEVFFFHSGGGVTISGGEVMMQADFAVQVLKGCLEHGIPTAIESSFIGKYEELEKMFPYLTACYVDYKIADDRLHKQFTGLSNSNISENIIKTHQNFKGEIHIRIPVIPTVNMSEENMIKTAQFLKPLHRVCDVELLPYHRLGMDTYRKLGMEYELTGVYTPSMEEMSKMAAILRKVNPACPVRIKGELFKDQ